MPSQLTGRSVVVTGKVPNHTRQTAEAYLRSGGAFVQSAVTKATDYLICGADVGAVKTNKAASLGVQVITWLDAIALVEGSGMAASVQAAQAQPAARGSKPSQSGYREVGPMLCKGTDALPASGDWIYEVKWDGYRGVAHVDGAGNAVIVSRQGNDLTGRFAEICAELAGLPSCVLDGEIVALDAEGRSNFAELHGEGPGIAANARYVVFDVVEVQGQDVRAWPIEQRKQLVTDLTQGGQLVTASPVFDDGQALYDYAVENELEGIVAKKAGSAYQEGKRGPAWLKIKIRCEQEFIVVGYTQGKGSRAGTAGALLLAVNDDNGDLVFCGSAGTGGTYDDFKAIVYKTTELADAPLAHDLTRAELRDVVWVFPDVVVQVRFQRWTPDGKLWHPSIQGLREDKQAHEVRREAVAA